MSQNTDELKLSSDVASERGVMQERCAQLEKENKQLEEKNAVLKKELMEKEAMLREKEERIKELEGMLIYRTEGKQGWTGQPLVVVNQYYLLDRPKTISYVCSLDADHRMFAGHMLMHTMPDSTPKQVYDQVTEMTQLTANPSERIADAMEKVAEQPKQEYNVYPQAGSTANVGCDQKYAEMRSYLPETGGEGEPKSITSNPSSGT